MFARSVRTDSNRIPVETESFSSLSGAEKGGVSFDPVGRCRSPSAARRPLLGSSQTWSPGTEGRAEGSARRKDGPHPEGRSLGFWDRLTGGVRFRHVQDEASRCLECEFGLRRLRASKLPEAVTSLGLVFRNCLVCLNHRV